MTSRAFPRGLSVFVLTGLLLFGLAGCGAGRLAPEQLASAQASFDEGTRAFDAGDFEKALQNLTQALETPGLLPDLIVDAYLTRARCYAELGDFAAALADIVVAEEGAGDLDRIHLTRGVVFQKQGQDAAARNEFQRAKQINPQLQLPR